MPLSTESAEKQHQQLLLHSDYILPIAVILLVGNMAPVNLLRILGEWASPFISCYFEYADLSNHWCKASKIYFDGSVNLI
jgi:hypothetical protein